MQLPKLVVLVNTPSKAYQPVHTLASRATVRLDSPLILPTLTPEMYIIHKDGV